MEVAAEWVSDILHAASIRGPRVQSSVSIGNDGDEDEADEEAEVEREDEEEEVGREEEEEYVEYEDEECMIPCTIKHSTSFINSHVPINAVRASTR